MFRDKKEGFLEKMFKIVIIHWALFTFLSIIRTQKLSTDLFLENISNANCMQPQSKIGLLTIPGGPNSISENKR